jgi:thioredoxin 1
LDNHPGVKHVKIADGAGRRLGRSYKVKLWPTLIFLNGGKEKARLVRPATSTEIVAALAEIDGGAA